MPQNLLGITSSSEEVYEPMLTLPLLGFECTWYEIKSRDMNEKGKEFIFYNKPYMPSAGLHGPLHMVCALSHVPATTLALDLHAHTQLYCLLLLGQRGGGVEGWRGGGVHVLSYSL